MKTKSIKLQRTESLLKELMAEALSSLSDPRINSLVVTDVDCSGGKYDAVVYVDPGILDEQEQQATLSQLSQARKALEDYVLAASGWFRCPKLHFEFDHESERIKRLDQLFAKIGESSHD